MENCSNHRLGDRIYHTGRRFAVLVFIGSRIQDGGRMENPDAYRAEKNLVEFEWRQSHRNFCSSFSLKFYQENDMPLLTGWFPSQSGGSEVRECGARYPAEE